MEEFAKMVEVYKWGGQPKGGLALQPRDIEGETSNSGCSEVLCRREETHSSPSPSFHHDLGHHGSFETTEPHATSAPDKSASSAAGCRRPRKRPNLKKRPRAATNRSNRQLVFSVGDLDAKGDTQRRVRSKREMPEKTTRSVSSCEDSTCEEGMPTTQDFSSPDTQYSVAEGRPGRTRKRGAHDALMYGKSPYFMPSMPSSRDNTKKVFKKNKKGLINKAECRKANLKSCFENQGRDGKTYIPDVKQLAGQSIGEPIAHSSEELLDPPNSGIARSKKCTSAGKKSAYFQTTVKGLGEREITNKTWVPPISVYALIQEELYKDPWKVLVACMLLNKTSGTQMRKIIWDLFLLCPTPEAAVAVETSKIEDVIRGLGLQKKRARMIQKFSKDYLGKDWTNVGQLHGIGKYATDAYAIFCEGRWQEVKPEDHKLNDYWKYLCATDGHGYAFKDDREKSHDMPSQVTSVEI